MIFPRVAPTQRTCPAVRDALRGCALLCAIFLCLHAAADSVQPKFPVEAALNKEAGRVVQQFSSDQWKLEKAWQTDQNGSVIEEYPIPSA